MDDSQKKEKIKAIEKEIQKIRLQMNMMGELAVRIYELLAEKAELEKANKQALASLPRNYQWLKNWQYV